jgi:tetraacyldisaccharide 4'-kinase
MFSNWFLKSFRVLLLPFALLYGLMIWIRNRLYDKNFFRSSSFGLPLICVGNLSVGGTGKSPMVELLVKSLKDHYRVATLSRGYKRKTRGYALATPQSTAIDIGDEPMLFHRKFPDVPVAVGEERIVAIPQLLHDHPDTGVVILDDAFQHRAITAGLNILLTDYGNLYTRDFFLPTGDLRDLPSSSRRADLIVVTKCPEALGEEERRAVMAELRPLPHQAVFFSTIAYGTPYHLLNHTSLPLQEETEVLLVTGIANPRPLKHYLEDRIHTYYMMHYTDHHIFTIDDWRDIQKRFTSMQAAEKIILTTEKDAMRLLKFGSALNGIPFYVIPIRHRFLFDGEEAFIGKVRHFIDHFKQPLT